MPNAVPNADIQAVDRVGQVCALFGPQVAELSAAEVAERTGMNRTTAYRYCTSMVAAGILERGSRRGTFTLGRLLLELGIQALGRQRVVELAGPHLRALSAATRLTAVLSIRGAQHPVVALVEEDTSGLAVVTVHPGTRLEANTAQTHLFLAFDDPAATKAWMQRLPAAARSRLAAEVAAIRRDGYCTVRDSGGVFVVAAPVFDDRGFCATVAVLGAGTLDLPPVLDELRATTTALGRELGGP